MLDKRGVRPLVNRWALSAPPGQDIGQREMLDDRRFGGPSNHLMAGQMLQSFRVHRNIPPRCVVRNDFASVEGCEHAAGRRLSMKSWPHIVLPTIDAQPIRSIPIAISDTS